MNIDHSNMVNTIKFAKLIDQVDKNDKNIVDIKINPNQFNIHSSISLFNFQEETTEQEGLRQLFLALKHNLHVKSLNLSQNYVSTSNMKLLGSILQINRTIEELYFVNSSYLDFQYIFKALKTNKFIKKIDFTGSMSDQKQMNLLNSILDNNLTLINVGKLIPFNIYPFGRNYITKLIEPSPQSIILINQINKKILRNQKYIHKLMHIVGKKVFCDENIHNDIKYQIPKIVYDDCIGWFL